MALLLAGVAVLVALIITPGLLLYFDVTPKAGVLLAGVAIGLPLVTYGKPGAPALPRLVRWFALLLGIQGVALLAATAWSPHWQLSIIGTNWRRFGLIAQLAVLAFAFLVTIVLAGRPQPGAAAAALYHSERDRCARRTARPSILAGIPGSQHPLT